MSEYELVRRLLAEQYPVLADEPITARANHGGDVAEFRVGHEFTVRLPRDEAASQRLVHETRFLPGLSRILPMPTPVPIHAGEPTRAFPRHWSVNRLLPGHPLGTGNLADPLVAAETLASVLGALHHPAPLDAPVNPLRGVPLPAVRRHLRADLAVLRRRGYDTARIEAAWQRLAQARRYRGYWHWVHGAMHPGSILVLDGWLSGVTEFGGLTRGDPANDYMVAWLVFDDPAHREPLREAASRHGRGTWSRGQAWAIVWAVAALARGDVDATTEAIAQRAIRNAV